MRHDESEAVPGRKTIRLRPLIAWLGTLPWVVAAASRSCGPASGEQRPLEDIPVAEWTFGDIARHERRG